MAVRKNPRQQNPADFTDGRLNGRGFRRLQALTRRLGSIRAAALAMGMSGQTAWRYMTGRATVPR
jgi:molybdenum-dependent DNA-binding transcriptional regulator ModE